MGQVYQTAPASATPVARAALRDAWIALLGRWEWEWFCTFTFRDMVHPEAADKRFRVLLSQANRVLFGHQRGSFSKRTGNVKVRVFTSTRYRLGLARGV
jgi:hypothetical protein